MLSFDTGTRSRALQRMAEEARPLMPTFKDCARRLYQDFMKAASAMAVAQ